MASQTATSWQSEDCTGRSDKTPVLPQHCRRSTCAILPWPTYQEPDMLRRAVDSNRLSPFGVGQVLALSPECLASYVSILAQPSKNGNPGTSPFLPLSKARGLLARYVDRYPGGRPAPGATSPGRFQTPQSWHRPPKLGSPWPARLLRRANQP